MPRVSSHFGLADPRLQSVSFPMILPVTLAAAGVTLTPAQTLSGLVSCSATGTLTLPTAAQLCEAIQGCMVGTSFEVMIKSTGAGSVTIAAGTGGSMSGTATVATVNIRTFLVNFTNVTIGQEAYTVYSEGQAPY
jgi:hypothetical protein